MRWTALVAQYYIATQWPENEWMNELPHGPNPETTCFSPHIFITIANYTMSTFRCINIRLQTAWPGKLPHTTPLHSWAKHNTSDQTPD